MKKVMLIILVCVLMLTGCTSKEKSDVKGASKIQLNNNDVLLSIKEESLTSDGATIIIKNNSDKNFGYSESYHLEKKQDDSWYTLNLRADATFNEPLWAIKPGNEVELEINWSILYGSLEPGEYRFIKDACFIIDRNTEEFYVGVEFVIE